MDASLIMERLQAIEGRLARLEWRARLSPSPLPDEPAPTPPTRATPKRTPPGMRVPAPIAASAPRAVPPIEPGPSLPTPRRAPAARKAIEWERFFGMAVLGRVGVLAVLLAAGYFAQLAYRELTDVVRVAAIYALAALFIGTGAYLRRRVSPRYVALLWGGGTAAAYLAGVVARLRYGLVSPPIALLLLVIASGLGHALARRLKHEALASTALAGAFAAPLLIGVTQDGRTYLLLYLATLTLWSAWLQRAWRWHGPRIVALCGLPVVALVWLATYGRLDASTYVHLSAYGLVLVSPELFRAFCGKRLGKGETGGVLVVAATISTLMWTATLPKAASGSGLSPLALPAFGPLAGVVWLALASGLAVAGRFARGRDLFRSLALLGGLLCVSGVAAISAFGPHWFGLASAADAGRLGAILLAALSIGLLVHARFVGAPELAATVGLGLLALLAAGQPSPPHALAMALAGLGTAAGIVRFARSRFLRSMAAWFGLAAVALGLFRTTRWGQEWILLPFAVSAAWIVFTQWVARTRRDRALVDNGLAGLVVLGLLWAALGFVGVYDHVTFPIANPMTLAGLALVCAAFFGALWMLRWQAPGKRSLRASAFAVTGMLGLLVIGHRETVSAVASLPPAGRDALHVTYLSLAAGLFHWVGVRRDRSGIRRLGIALLAGAVLKAALDTLDPPQGMWPSLALLAPLATSWVFAAWPRQSNRETGAAALGSTVFLALTWIGYVLEARFPAQPAVVNLRAATGLLLIVGAYAVAHARRRHACAKTGSLVLLASTLGLIYLVGFFELQDLARPLAGSWPRVLVSVYTTLFAAGLLTLGFVRGDTRLRYPALAAFAVVVLKVGLYDLGGTPLPLRILVTGILGLVLLGAAFAYARVGARAPGPATPGPDASAPPAG